MRTFTVVLRCRSAARFRPEEGQIVTIANVAGVDGEMAVRMRTRWLDEGFESPTPRELWLDARCTARTLETAISASTGVARLLAAIAAFTANVASSAPEVHIGFDSTPGVSEREFVEVFLPDERGLPSEGRLINTDEFAAAFERLTSSDESSRLSRALNHYNLALRSWFIGGEYLALAHLYMAVEALTRSAIRAELARLGVDEEELARQHGIDPDDPARPRWRPALEAWARRELIFNQDGATYDAARQASDGVEHGFMEMSDLNKRALFATATTFGYVRASMLSLLGISEDDFPDLFSRPPRDVLSLRKLVRGRLLGDSEELAPEGEEYPYLEWRSQVRSVTRDEDEFSVTFDEHFTVRTHPDIHFEGHAFEARGRLEEGRDPIRLDAPMEVRTGEPSPAGPKEALSATGRALRFAESFASSAGQSGMTVVQALAMQRCSMQVALGEAVQVLVVDGRSAEAIPLLAGLIRNTCLLQLSAEPDNGSGTAIRAHLDALDRIDDLYGSDVKEASDQTREQLLGWASDQGFAVPSELPSIRSTPFFERHGDELAFADEIAMSDVAAIQLHLRANENGPGFFTKTPNERIPFDVSAIVITALVASTTALAVVCDLHQDEETASELLALADELVGGEA